MADQKPFQTGAVLLHQQKPVSEAANKSTKPALCAMLKMKTPESCALSIRRRRLAQPLHGELDIRRL
jgi:hypothetical protein